jgi:hypothetical protein
MSDMRQGVTKPVHAVLDILDDARPIYRSVTLPHLRRSIQDILANPSRRELPGQLQQAAAMLLALVELVGE